MEEQRQLPAVESEKEVRKNRIRFRWFIILIIIDVLLAGYLVYEMISIFTNK